MLPATLHDFREYVARTLTRDVAVGPAARALARLIFQTGGVMLRPAAAVLELITVGLLPPEVRRLYGYPWSRRRERLLDAFAAAVRMALPAMPRGLRVVPPARAVEQHIRLAAGRSAPAEPRTGARLPQNLRCIL
jgi:uncharacterized protein (DUF2236 family)